jgi:hypothetical protein
MPINSTDAIDEEILSFEDDSYACADRIATMLRAQARPNVITFFTIIINSFQYVG